MSDGSRRIETEEDQFYFQEAQKLRLRVAEQIESLGLSGAQVVNVVHRIDDRHPNRLFDPRSYTLILMHAERPEEPAPGNHSNVHIVSKELLHFAASAGTVGSLYNHFGLFGDDSARLRHHGELQRVDTSAYLDKILGGPTFSADYSAGMIKVNPDHFDWLSESDTKELKLDDRVFNTTRADMYAALRHAHKIMDIVSADTVLLHQSA